MIISYNAEPDLIKPVRNTVKSEEVIAINEFLNSNNESIVFEYEEEDLARKKRNNIAVHARKDSIPVKAILRGKKVIVLRKVQKTND